MTKKNILNTRNGVMIIFIFLIEKRQEGQGVYFLITYKTIGRTILNLLKILESILEISFNQRSKI